MYAAGNRKLARFQITVAYRFRHRLGREISGVLIRLPQNRFSLF